MVDKNIRCQWRPGGVDMYDNYSRHTLGVVSVKHEIQLNLRVQFAAVFMLQFLPSNTFIPPCNPCSVYQFISNERYKLELLFRKTTEHEHMETVRLDICS